MARARKFNSVKAAQDWLVARGFAKTATQHIWKNGSRMAVINAELGGVIPRFTINIQAGTTCREAWVYTGEPLRLGAAFG